MGLVGPVSSPRCEPGDVLNPIIPFSDRANRVADEIGPRCRIPARFSLLVGVLYLLALTHIEN